MSLPRSACAYHPFYCEENVWHLARRFEGLPREVLFISNRSRTCALWNQRAGGEGMPVVWDYHVVLLMDGMVYDLDTRLDFPTPLERWLDATFPMEVPPVYRPRFRIVDGDRFLARFESDRSHMKSEDGWAAPPPPWPPISKGSNLMRFVDTETPFEGEVFDLEALRHRGG